MDLQAEWERVTTTDSDIIGHLRYMHDLAVTMDAQKVVELGVRNGNSTIAWLHALEMTGGQLWSIDIEPAPAWLDHPAWSFHRGDDMGDAALSWIPAYDIDLVFVDTDHLYEHTIDELLAYRPFVRPGGAMVLHDVELERSPFDPRHTVRYPVKNAIDCFRDTHPGTTMELRHGCYGLATLWV